MSEKSGRSFGSALVIGLVAGAGILQLLPASGPAAPDAAAGIELAPVAAAVTAQPAPDFPGADAAAQPAPAGRAPTAGFMSTERLEEEIPSSVVELLIERQAILIEEGATDAP
ncbi:MAG: hypothetical protein OEM97_06675 [Acidimicrobiia bacterium]|nr:hypothetical protein [Acidimicrobiia bacterium]